MLLHVTHAHSPESCPGPHPDRMRTFNAGFSKLEEMAESNGVKLVSFAFAFPEHVAFLLIDAPSVRAAQSFLGAAFPGIPSTVRLTPVVDLAEAKEVVAQ